MTKNNNEVAAALATVGNEVLPDHIVRELWEQGGHRANGPVPVTAAEIRKMPAHEAAAFAEWIVSPDECAKLLADTRVTVRLALANNPAIDDATAAELIRWYTDRREAPPFELATIAGPEKTAAALGDTEAVLKDPRKWIKLFGNEQLSCLAGRRWSNRLLSIALVDAESDDEWVDATWCQADKALHREVVNNLLGKSGHLSAAWARRLTQIDDLGEHLTNSVVRHGYGKFTIDDDVDLEGLARAAGSTNSMVRFFRRLEARAGELTPSQATAVADALVDLYIQHQAVPDVDDALWIIARVSTDRLLTLAHAELVAASVRPQVIEAFMDRPDLPALTACDLVTFAASVKVFASWVGNNNGHREVGHDQIAQALAAFPEGRNARDDAAKAVVSKCDLDAGPLLDLVVRSDAALEKLVTSQPDPLPLIEQLVAAATDRPLPEPVGPHASALHARIVNHGRLSIGHDVFVQVLKLATIAETDRLAVATAAKCIAAFARAAFDENPPTDVALKGADLSAPELVELASVQTVSANVRAKVLLAAPTASPTSLVDAVLAAGPLDKDLSDRLLAQNAIVKGRALAGAYEHLVVTEEYLALDEWNELEVLNEFASTWSPCVHGVLTHRSLDEHHLGDSLTRWVRSIPAVFTNIGNRSLAAVVLDATDRVLGDDDNSWRILAELANGTSFSINEVVDLVEFSH